ncbi:hypothetical protein C496_05927 [Natronorubrum tibetense GA33]|uniref:Uncharacterized protein n=1 Tax=Natronorubrum tibetense GA33 TaxID=1114856 RepID=L9W3D3_9EURY|nr:hypothetical protein C496_05927 [Natronorubrum tibetense GA33]
MDSWSNSIPVLGSALFNTRSNASTPGFEGCVGHSTAHRRIPLESGRHDITFGAWTDSPKVLLLIAVLGFTNDGCRRFRLEKRISRLGSVA